MRRVVCRQFAPIDELVVEEVDAEACGPGFVRVAVEASGVNFVDGLIVQGLYQVKPPLPYVPGGEVAGTVAEVGPGVEEFHPGERVLGLVSSGGFANEVLARPEQLFRTPPALSSGQAATFSQSYLTGWFALHHRAHAQQGQTILVLGAGSGLGLAAVDLAHSMGLRVLAAASSAEKRAAAAAMGADVVIDSTNEDVKDRARVESGGGVDLVYDPVGGALGESCLRALGDDGQFLVLGFASGAIPRLPANQVLLRNRRVTGVEWGGWVGKHPAEHRAMTEGALAEVAAGRLSPVEPTCYPLADAVRALAELAGRNVTGKIALVP